MSTQGNRYVCYFYAHIAGIYKKKVRKRSMSKVTCVDVSSWNGDINWNRVREAGITHAILKVIRRDLDKDNQFENNWRDCQLSGVHICGVYNYVYTTSVEEAVTVANKVLEALEGRKVPIWMDIEDACMQNLGEQLIDIIKAYKHTIEEAGYEFGIYTGLSWYGSYIAPYADEEILNCRYWIARYNLGYEQMNVNEEPAQDKKPDVTRYLAGWQYTSSGIVDGIEGVADLSEFYEHPETDEGVDQGDDNSNLDNDNADEPVNVIYAAYTEKWWPEVTNREDWAGKGDDSAITAIAIRADRGGVKYRVHTTDGVWLPYVISFDYDDFENGFAGDQRTPIDAIEAVYMTEEGEPWKYAHYIVSVFDNRNFYPEQIDAETRDGMDGYAGVLGKAIDKFQMWIE